jgi:anti-anti-sigma regulatory factor
MISEATRLGSALRWEKTRWTDEICEAWIAGCADIISAPILAELSAELHGCRKVVLDVSALSVADATFLRFLLRLYEPGRRSVRVLGARNQLKRILEKTGLGNLFS